MHFVPWVTSSQDPALWAAVPRLELQLEGFVWNSKWIRECKASGRIRTLHFPEDYSPPEALKLVEFILREQFDLDFIVLPVVPLTTRQAEFDLIQLLEGLLEGIGPRGIKMALKTKETKKVVDLLRMVRGEALGYCWHSGLNDFSIASDRIFTACSSGHDDLRQLHDAGYRWDVAIRSVSPEEFCRQEAQLSQRYPPRYFPNEFPKVPVDPEVKLGDVWSTD